MADFAVLLLSRRGDTETDRVRSWLSRTGVPAHRLDADGLDGVDVRVDPDRGTVTLDGESFTPTVTWIRHFAMRGCAGRGSSDRVMLYRDSWQALVGHDIAWLTFAIVAENFTSAIGTVIFVAYLSALCRNPLHTATQYALLTALAAVGRTYLSSGAGYVAKATGWPMFFAICVLVAIPSLILLAWLQRRGHFEALGPVKV